MEANKHKSGHAFHKNEMEHHKMRDKHKAAHDNGNSSGEIPNPKMAKDNHQVGIARKLQKHGDMPVGQHGSMSGGWKHERQGK